MTQSAAEEVKKRLTEISKSSPQHMDMQRLMTRYAIERFMWRIGQSRHADKFTLKGAMAFTYYARNSSRTTKDVDFMLRGHYSLESVRAMLSEIAAQEAEDGLTFQPDVISVRLAGKERAYPGCIAKIPARLGASACHVDLDISFGESVYPDARRVTLPALIVGDALLPSLRIYPIETIIAEKYQTIVRLGMSNTRLKDHHDLYEISSSSIVAGGSLKMAIQATFERRGTPITAELPLGLSEQFYTDKGKQRD
jgi:predicted nucleotidyltransferase component of viral defense system